MQQIEQVGVFLVADDGTVEAVFGGVAVGERGAVGDGEGAAGHGVIFAGAAGGRGGGADGHLREIIVGV